MKVISKKIAVFGALLVIVSASVTTASLAQRKIFSGSIKAQLKPGIRAILMDPKTVSSGTLTAECEVLQSSKTANKPPYYQYRTGRIAFKMAGDISTNLYVNVSGAVFNGASYMGQQPSQSEKFAAGKYTGGVANDGSTVPITFETVPLGQQFTSPLSLNITGSGITEAADSNGAGTGIFLWSGTMNCPVGWL
jgi:hypothetical protein